MQPSPGGNRMRPEAGWGVRPDALASRSGFAKHPMFERISGKIAYTYIYGCFTKIGVPQNGWFIMKHPIKMDDLGVSCFWKHPYIYIYIPWKSTTIMKEWHGPLLEMGGSRNGHFRNDGWTCRGIYTYLGGETSKMFYLFTPIRGDEPF